VLIESNRPTKAPLPVLTRGDKDRGIPAQGSLIPPYPTLTEIKFTALEDAKRDLNLSPSQADFMEQSAAKTAAAKLGEKLTLQGYNLNGSNVRVFFNHPSLDQPNEIAQNRFQESTSTLIKLTIPTDRPDRWPPGFYTVTVEVTAGSGTLTERKLTTNGLPLPLAPEIEGNITAVRDNVDLDTAILTVTCKSLVTSQQRVSLILTVLKEPAAVINAPALEESLGVVSGVELLAKVFSGKTNTLEFELGKDTLERLGIRSDTGTDKRIRAGTYEIRPRLRVDGVDSLSVDYLKRPPEFIGQQNLVIPP
jgi:hypothetical protein